MHVAIKKNHYKVRRKETKRMAFLIFIHFTRFILKNEIFFVTRGN